MSRNVIFCFSGSGNCLDIAKNIAKVLHDTDIVMMKSEPVITDVSDAERVGFVLPCFAGGLPGHVEEYVSKIKVSPKAYTFGVVSYAGYMGVGLSVINKYIPLLYWTGISHHCSCIWLFPHSLTMPPLSVEKSQQRSEKLAAKAAQDILAGKFKKLPPPSNPINAVEAKAWPLLCAEKAEKMRVNESCVGCGQCVTLCPENNIRLENGKAVIGKSCIQCLSCLQFCPTQAIDLGGASVKRQRYHNIRITAEELSRKLIHID